MFGIPTLLEQGLQPDVFEEIEGLEDGHELTYIGYFKNGDPTNAMIKKVEKIETVTTIMFPNGINDYTQNWASRTALNYTFKR